MKISGFTLIELLIVLTLISSALLLAIPVSQHLITENRVANDINHLLSGLYFARSEAIQRGATITLCKSADKNTCGGQWRDGQIIIDAAGKILHVNSGLSSNAELSWRSSFGLNDLLKFSPTGFAGQQGSFYYRLLATDKIYERRIVINHAGRIWVSET